MNPQDREEYGMDLAIKQREGMSEEYIKIEPSEAKIFECYYKYGDEFIEITLEREIFLIKEVFQGDFYRKKAEPKEAFKKWWKKDYKAYLSMNSPDLAELTWNASRESLFAELSEEEWEFLKCIYNHPYNRDISNKLIRLALATRKD